MPLVNSINSTQNFSNIHWPVWVIRPHEHIGEGLITDRHGIRRIDLADKSMPFPKRRLAIKVLKDYKVYPLRKAIWNFKDLLASKILDFIDFEGKIYHYTKSVYAGLLHIDKGYLLYEVTTEKLKDTKRKI